MTRPATYIMEASDLDEHHRDCFGKFWHPNKLGVPLCATCDTVIVDGACPGCTITPAVHARGFISDEQLTVVRGDPFLNRKVA